MLRPFLKEAKREGKESRVRQKRAKSATLLNSRQEKDKE